MQYAGKWYDSLKRASLVLKDKVCQMLITVLGSGRVSPCIVWLSSDIHVVGLWVIVPLTVP